jgi:anti-sigma regulatory factor (Ser/Thr protein kinase)
MAAVPDAVAHARRFALSQLRKWGLEPLADDVELVTSELVTNAVRKVGHADLGALARTEPPVIVLRLRLTARRLFSEVWDPSPEPPVPVQAGALDESGRGMVLVSALSSRWASYPSPGGQGKVVLAWWELGHSVASQPP